VKAASQSELSQVDGVGNALAARIKADVGGLEVDEEADAEIEDETDEEEEADEADTDEDVETELRPRGHADKTPNWTTRPLARSHRSTARGNRSSTGRTTTRRSASRRRGASRAAGSPSSAAA